MVIPAWDIMCFLPVCIYSFVGVGDCWYVVLAVCPCVDRSPIFKAYLCVYVCVRVFAPARTHTHTHTHTHMRMSA